MSRACSEALATTLPPTGKKEGGNAWETGWTTMSGIDGTTTTFTVTGLKSDTTYRFKVRGVNSSGEGAESPASDEIAGFRDPTARGSERLARVNETIAPELARVFGSESPLRPQLSVGTGHAPVVSWPGLHRSAAMQARIGDDAAGPRPPPLAAGYGSAQRM